MPGSSVRSVLIVGPRGSGKTEHAAPLFLSFPFGFWLDIGREASNYFEYRNKNRQRLLIRSAPDVKSAVAYLSDFSVRHFSYRPKHDGEIEQLFFALSKVRGRSVWVDDAQRYLSHDNSSPGFMAMLSAGRMLDQNLIVCTHYFSQVPIPLRGDATEIYYIGPLRRPADVNAIFQEYAGEAEDKRALLNALRNNAPHAAFRLR